MVRAVQARATVAATAAAEAMVVATAVAEAAMLAAARAAAREAARAAARAAAAEPVGFPPAPQAGSPVAPAYFGASYSAHDGQRVCYNSSGQNSGEADEWFGTRAEAEHRCALHPSCGWIHDWSCDDSNWRYCSSVREYATGAACVSQRYSVAPPPPPPPSPPSLPPPPYTFTSRAVLSAAVYAFKRNPASATATYGPMADWDVSAVSDMSRLFSSRENFNVDLSNWNTSGVTDMSRMFDVRSTPASTCVLLQEPHRHPPCHPPCTLRRRRHLSRHPSSPHRICDGGIIYL